MAALFLHATLDVSLTWIVCLRQWLFFHFQKVCICMFNQRKKKKTTTCKCAESSKTLFAYSPNESYVNFRSIECTLHVRYILWTIDFSGKYCHFKEKLEEKKGGLENLINSLWNDPFVSTNCVQIHGRIHTTNELQLWLKIQCIQVQPLMSLQSIWKMNEKELFFCKNVSYFLGENIDEPKTWS